MKGIAGLLRFSGRLVLALSSAVLLGIYAWWPSLAGVCYVALVPWVLLYTDDRESRVSLGYYFLAAYVTWILVHPQAFRFGWFVPFGMAAVLFVPGVVFAPLLRRIHHRFALPRSLSVPLAWVTMELLRATFAVSHWDFYRLGYSQARFGALVQIADVVGVYGLSFLVAAVNGLCADLAFALRDERWSLARAVTTRRVALGAMAIAAGFGLVSLYGVYRLGTTGRMDGPRLAIVQPNLHHTIRNAVGVHLGQIVLTATQIDTDEADLIVWPENAILDSIYREGAYLEDLAWLAEDKQSFLLVGALGEPEGRPGKTTNAAFLLDKTGAVLKRYDKLVLFPWSEYVPFDGVLEKIAPSLQRAHRAITRKGWGFLPTGTRGREMTLFTLPWQGEELSFATLICNENTYPPIPAEAGRQGARFFVNITSEGLVGGPVQEQLLRISILRAVENRIPYVRVGNTGISGFIDARGQVVSLLRGERGHTIGVAGVLVERIALSVGNTTIYARSHDAFAVACTLVTFILFVWSYVSRRPRQRAR